MKWIIWLDGKTIFSWSYISLTFFFFFNLFLILKDKLGVKKVKRKVLIFSGGHAGIEGCKLSSN